MQTFVLANIFFMKGYDFLAAMLELTLSKLLKVSKSATACLTAIFANSSSDCLRAAIERLESSTASPDLEKKLRGVYGLMSVVLSTPLEVKPWTEKLLLVILQNKQKEKLFAKKLEQFASTFLNFLDPELTGAFK